MIRPNTRRALRLESLESRALLSSGGPSAQQQYMLELINMARTNPAEMESWIQSNLTPSDVDTINHYGVNLQATLTTIGSTPAVQPLAWSDTLAGTATEQSQYEANNQVQTHDGPGEPDLLGRLSAAGYNNPSEYGENSYAYAQSVDQAMIAFLVDWGVPDAGHRGNLMQPGTPDANTYTEVGIGIVGTSPGSTVGPFVMTQDFGRPANFTSQLVGVVYNDPNGNTMADLGAGLSGVTITVYGANGQQVATTTTSATGYYQIPLAPGNYTVTATNGSVTQSQNVAISNDNFEANFNTGQSQSQTSQATGNSSADSGGDSSGNSGGNSSADSGGDSSGNSGGNSTGDTTGTSTGNPVQIRIGARLQIQNLNQANASGGSSNVIAGPVPTTNSFWQSGWSLWRTS